MSIKNLSLQSIKV